MPLRRSKASATAGKALLKEQPRYQCSDATVHASIVSTASYHAVLDRRLKGCLSVKTQRESLNSTLHHSSSGGDSAVRFGTVEIRSYPVILGNNPSPSAGPPVGIGWQHDPEATLKKDIDSYEESRASVGSRRSKAEHLKIAASAREEMLLEAGYSREEIRLATLRAQKDKLRRVESLRLLNQYGSLFMKVDTAKGFVKRGFKVGKRQSSADYYLRRETLDSYAESRLATVSL